MALKGLLAGHDVTTVRDMGWRGTSNGALLKAAQEAGFEVFVTGDKKFWVEQPSLKMALLMLHSTQWQTVRAGAARVLQALDAVGGGDHREVELERPKLRMPGYLAWMPRV